MKTHISLCIGHMLPNTKHSSMSMNIAGVLGLVTG